MKQTLATKWETDFLGIIYYADDVVLLAENEDNLQRLLYRFNITAHKLYMVIYIPQ